MKPVSGPKAIPVSIINANMGLKLGMGTATREIVAIAAITATVTSSRGLGFLPSKVIKNGIRISSAAKVIRM